MVVVGPPPPDSPPPPSCSPLVQRPPVKPAAVRWLPAVNSCTYRACCPASFFRNIGLGCTWDEGREEAKEEEEEIEDEIDGATATPWNGEESETEGGTAAEQDGEKDDVITAWVVPFPPPLP